MLQPAEALTIGALLTSFQGSNFPIRRPSYTRPSFWSKPIFATRMRPIAAGGDWENFLSVSGLKQYIAVVSHFTATSIGNIALTGIEFRMRLDGMPLPMDAVNFAPGIELSKTGANEYPVIPRKLFQPVLETQTLTLQVRNVSAFQRNAVASFQGWYFEAMDSTLYSGADNGIADAGYPGETGATYV